MAAELAAIRQQHAGRRHSGRIEPEKSAVWARFAVAVARIAKCTVVAAEWAARAGAGWAALEVERARAEATVAALEAMASGQAPLGRRPGSKKGGRGGGDCMMAARAPGSLRVGHGGREDSRLRRDGGGREAALRTAGLDTR
jgi:hypothetical protein